MIKAYLDIDGVVANTGQAIIDLIKKKFHKNDITVEDIKEYEIPKLPWLTREEIEQLLLYFNDPEFYYYIPPLPDGPEVTRCWQDKGIEIVFVTARPAHLFEITLYWLRKHGFAFNHLIMSSPFEKVNHCDTNGTCLLVEDRPDVLYYIQTHRPHIKLFLYDQPWNRHIDIGTRIKSLKDIDIEQLLK